MQNNNNSVDYGRPKGLAIDALAWEMGQANKRLFILLVITWIVMVVSFFGMWVYISSWETETVMIEAEQEADGLGRNFVIGGDYGYETEGQDN